MTEIALVIDNVRSIYNVGSLLRTAEGLGVKQVFTYGITPTIKQSDDNRLPHVIKRVETQLNKTALGAEKVLDIKHIEKHNLSKVLSGYQIVALEQTEDSLSIDKAKYFSKVALVVGNEVDGVSAELLDIADLTVDIPMQGTKNSFNVSVAGAIGIYHIKNCGKL